MSVISNNVCLLENLLPTYTLFIYIYIYIYISISLKIVISWPKLLNGKWKMMSVFLQPYDPLTSSIGVALLGSQWSKESSTAAMTSSYELLVYELFRRPSFVCAYIHIYIVYVCMCVCACACVWVCGWVLYTFIRIYALSLTKESPVSAVDASIRQSNRFDKKENINLNICLRICFCIHVYIYIYIYVVFYIHIWVYTRKHPLTHTNIYVRGSKVGMRGGVTWLQFSSSTRFFLWGFCLICRTNKKIWNRKTERAMGWKWRSFCNQKIT